MAGHPKHIVDQAKAPHGRQGIWNAIVAVNGAFTVRQIWQGCNLKMGYFDIDIRTVRSYINVLERAEIITQYCDTNPKAFLLGRDQKRRQEAPRINRKGQVVVQGQGRRRMWQAMRVLGDFSSDDICAFADVSLGTAKEYCRFLYLAGYLTISRKATNKLGMKRRFRFIKSKNTGRYAPMIQKTKRVYDPNLKKVVYERVTEQKDEEVAA